MSTVTIRINTRSKAGRNLIELARNLAAKYKGIEFLLEDEDEDFAAMIDEGMKSDTMSDAESEVFIAEMRRLAEK